MENFNFKLEPGKVKENKIEYIEHEPVISVIVPSYNSQEYIEQTIVSILNQTFPYYEIFS